ncbi:MULTISPECIES: hypothetical protein [unclassified Streptomyces]|uniref:hypothetical protein n=1 Tax=unclassified Streptomyces TaxID=2593676 RepID=UPI00225974C9|nr:MULTISPECIES: hypothetical protein [unclassified Streptomyces]MCX5050278.1 hypothetical protein [Streptomyces sp. NBC_00474]
MFGRKQAEPVIEPVPWERAGWFAVTDMVRQATLRRKKLTGQRAVRMATAQGGVRYFAPVALVSATEDEIPSYALYEATRPESLLCALTPEKRGARYRVTDGQGIELGLAHRTPAAKRTIQHSWWLQQPGHADIVARYHWARGNAKDVAERGKETVVRGAGKLAEGVVDSLLSFGADEDSGGAGSYTAKPITWRAEGEEEPVALTAGRVEGATTYLPQAAWLDRRLAFALGVLREV